MCRYPPPWSRSRPGPTPSGGSMRHYFPHPTASVRHPTDNIRRPTNYVSHPMDNIRHPMNYVRHPIDHIRHPMAFFGGNGLGASRSGKFCRAARSIVDCTGKSDVTPLSHSPTMPANPAPLPVQKRRPGAAALQDATARHDAYLPSAAGKPRGAYGARRLVGAFGRTRRPPRRGPRPSPRRAAEKRRQVSALQTLRAAPRARTARSVLECGGKSDGSQRRWPNRSWFHCNLLWPRRGRNAGPRIQLR